MVLLVPLFCGLGVWQLDRAEQKRQLAGSVEARRKLPVASLNRDDWAPDDLTFRRISADGHFLPEQTVLIENRKHLGKTGFHVITPLRLVGTQQVVLVNRGWIPHQRLTDAEPLPTPEGQVYITGVITRPQPPALALAFSDQGGQTPPHWPYLTLDHFAAWSDMEILPFAVLQSPADAGGFIRDWPQPQFNDGMHIGYAIQWFAFALISLLIWWRLSLPKQTAQGAER